MCLNSDLRIGKNLSAVSWRWEGNKGEGDTERTLSKINWSLQSSLESVYRRDVTLKGNLKKKKVSSLCATLKQNFSYNCDNF